MVVEMDTPTEITQLINRVNAGDTNALDLLTIALYPDLKSLARHRARGSNMGATTVVHEMFVRYLSSESLEPANRREFFALAATIMRRVIVDEVRQATAQKRRAEKTGSYDLEDNRNTSGEFLLQVDQGLKKLAERDERLRQVFDCRYFAGYSTAETAEYLNLTNRTVERLWQAAKQQMAGYVGSPT